MFAFLDGRFEVIAQTCKHLCRADAKGTHKVNVAARHNESQDSAHGCMGPVSGKLEAHELALLSFLL